MIGLVVEGLALVLLIACWLMGEWEFQTKIVFTLVYLGTWGLLFIDGWLHLGAQALLAVILWYGTFGLSRR
jgi:hypothetical protein